MDREPDSAVQLKLRFKEDLRRRVEVSAERNGSSLNSEFVRRVEHSFDIETSHGGPATAALIAQIVADIAEIEAETGKSWATDNETYSAVRRALLATILDRAPPRVENNDEVVATLQEVLARTKAVTAGYQMMQAIEAGVDMRVVNGAQDRRTPEQLGELRDQLSVGMPEAEALMAEAEKAADLAYEPQRQAERRGRALFARIRRDRQRSAAARARR